MKKIRIADMTLRYEAQSADFSLSFKEKTEIVKELDKLGVDVIELAPITEKKADTLLVRTVASLVKNSVLACPVGETVESVESTWNAVMDAVSPRLIVAVPVSSVQMEYSSGKKPDTMLAHIEKMVKECAAVCNDVEFCAEDATRAERDFLYQAIEKAITCGATTVTVCDTAGTMMPDEFPEFIDAIFENVPAASTITIGVSCTDDMKMAAACAFASVVAGAGEVKVTVNGINTPDIETIATVFRARGDSRGFSAGIDMTGLRRSAARMTRITNTERRKTSAFDNEFPKTVPSGEINLDESADISAVESAIKAMGYDIADDDLTKIYEAVRRIVVKKSVGAKELDAIIASTAMQVSPAYKVISYVINSGNIINATAHIKMEKDGRELTGLVTGDGPIDAAFLAIEQIVGCHYELDDFQIQAVTEGREAMGSALVKLRAGGKLFSGHGVSTDVIGASIRAYVDAINKIVYEETMR